MAGWQKAEMRERGNPLELSDRLEAAVVSFGTSVEGQIPPGFGVFSWHDQARNKDSWYFSPEAAPLAGLFGGEPCEKPVPQDGFGLLAGNASSGEIHFPAYFPRRWVGE